MIIPAALKLREQSRTPAMRPLTRKAIGGAAFLTAQVITGKVATFIGQLILSWILQPEDFGLVGLTYSLAAFSGIIQSVGLGEFLVRRRRFELWVEPAIWLALCLAGCSVLIMMTAGPIGARLYNEPRVVGLLAVLASAVPFSALNVILMAVIQARMQFRSIAAIGSIAVLSNVALSIGFAIYGYGVYSFVLPIPIVEAARLAVLWTLARPRMQWKPQPRLWRYFAGTSLFLFLSSICALFVAQGDYMLLGVFQTTETVGLYFFGFTVATQMIRLVQGSVTSVLFPVLSSIRLEPRRLLSGFTRTISVVSIVVVPVCMLQAAIADPLIRSLFAAKWIPAIPIIQLLSISMALHCVAEPCVALLQAQGRFVEMFRNYLIWTIGFLPIVAIAAKRGDGTTVAAAVASYYLVGSPIFFWSVTRRLGFAPLDVLRAYALPALASGLSAALAIGVANMLRPPFILTMVIVSTIFGLTYTVLISVIAREPWAEVVQLGRHFIRGHPCQPSGVLENLVKANSTP